MRGQGPADPERQRHDALQDEKDLTQALTGSIADPLRLGCAGIGFTIYPGSTQRLEMYQQIRAYAEEAKRHGLVVIIWSYPRGSSISKTGENGDRCVRLRRAPRCTEEAAAEESTSHKWR